MVLWTCTSSPLTNPPQTVFQFAHHELMAFFRTSCRIPSFRTGKCWWPHHRLQWYFKCIQMYFNAFCTGSFSSPESISWRWPSHLLTLGDRMHWHTLHRHETCDMSGWKMGFLVLLSIPGTCRTFYYDITSWRCWFLASESSIVDECNSVLAWW